MNRKVDGIADVAGRVDDHAFPGLLRVISCKLGLQLVQESTKHMVIGGVYVQAQAQVALSDLLWDSRVGFVTFRDWLGDLGDSSAQEDSVS